MNKRAIGYALCLSVLLCGGLPTVAHAGQPPATDPAPDVPPSAEQTEEIDPRALDEGDVDESLPFTNPCYEAWRCPDPLAAGNQALPADKSIVPPDVIPKPRKGLKPVRKLVLFQDGYIIRIKTFRRVGMARGFTPPPGSAPWQVQLQRPRQLLAVTQRMLNWDDRLACGGSLIAPGWVVTAAHCVVDYGANVKDAGYRLRLGVSDISNAEQGVSYRIAEIQTNPTYDPKTHFGDIALIRFEADAETARGKRVWVQSIMVDASPVASRRNGGKRAYFYGWGNTQNDQLSAPLQIGVVELQPDRSCRNSGIALCGLGIGRAGAAQCHGDSGGPLVVFEANVPTLIGIVSHNVGRTVCGENRLPGVFTRVASYRTWIEQHTGRLAGPPAAAARAR